MYKYILTNIANVRSLTSFVQFKYNFKYKHKEIIINIYRRLTIKLPLNINEVVMNKMLLSFNYSWK